MAREKGHDGYNLLRNFWLPMFAYSLLLGVQLLLLGIALAGLGSALRRRSFRERNQPG
jgi:hypothetical protein